MKLNKKTKLVFILVALFLIGLAVPSYSWTRKNAKEIEIFYTSKLSPIIMIPGSSATENRFDGLVRKLNKDRRGTKHSLLKVKVWNNGRITFEGNIRKNDNSNGGLIYTAFIENYLSDYDVKINSLMTIGTPYNFTETNIKNKSVMLADFIAAKENIPSTLHVYSVAGTITYDSDELVPNASVSAGKYIYQNQAKSYTEITVTGEDAQHSDLPTNDEVVDLVKQHIEGQGLRKK